jgi:hypothetical protein
MACGAVVSSAILVALSLLDAARAHYTPTWAVHVPAGKEAADAVARDHGFANLGEVRVFYNTMMMSNAER